MYSSNKLTAHVTLLKVTIKFTNFQCPCLPVAQQRVIQLDFITHFYFRTYEIAFERSFLMILMYVRMLFCGVEKRLTEPVLEAHLFWQCLHILEESFFLDIYFEVITL